jgi:outer membrane immunogenic protein
MSLTKDRILSTCLAASLFAVPVTTFAGADSGFYIGVGAGEAAVEVKDANFDESDTSYKVFGGYNIGFIPLVDFAVEAAYVDFGSPSAAIGSIDVSSVNAFGLAGLSFGPFGIFAKAGMSSWDADSSGGSESGTDPAYGLGARLSFGSFAVRAEYELYEFDQADVEMISVSGVYTF